jgi:uncharacterized protein YbaR (Trm112 family)
LKGTFTGKWFTRLVLISCLVSAVSILVVFKSMEYIVHGQLYNFGLVFSSEWADAYRVLTWLIFLCVGVPMALSGFALATSFLKVEEIPKTEHMVPQKVGPPRGIAPKAASQQIRPTQTIQKTLETEKLQHPIRRSSNELCCPKCKKVFGRALVMLDFRNGANRMVSVCPYCNNVLGYTSEERSQNITFSVAEFEEKLAK